MHLPLLIRWPEHIPAGTRVDALVQNIDLAPTFLEMAGAPVPDRMQGAHSYPFSTAPRRRTGGTQSTATTSTTCATGWPATPASAPHAIS